MECSYRFQKNDSNPSIPGNNNVGWQEVLGLLCIFLIQRTEVAIDADC